MEHTVVFPTDQFLTPNFWLNRQFGDIFNMRRQLPRYKMKLAVLTSGGDSAGMNAVVRAVVKTGIVKYGIFPSAPIASHPHHRLPTGDAKHGLFAKGMKVLYVATPMNTGRRRCSLHLIKKSKYKMPPLCTICDSEMESY